MTNVECLKKKVAPVGRFGPTGAAQPLEVLEQAAAFKRPLVTS
jgi:hypothetical protein